MASVAFKNRTRDEIIAAFRESIRKKHEWQEKAEKEIEKIRQERLQLSIWWWIHSIWHIKNFAALIVQKSNPRLTEIVSEFRETISILTNKPE